MSLDDLDPDVRRAMHRRSLWALRASQVPSQAAVAGVVAVVALLAADLLGSDQLAGTGSAGFTMGAALTAVPLAAMMRRRGRRPGLITAFSIGAAGALLAGVGGQLRSFPLFVAGMVLFGAGQAGALQSRYVAGDLAAPDERATAISAIVWVGTLGAVFGPLLTPFEKRAGEAIGLDEYIGPFGFASALFALAAVISWWRLRPDPLAVVGGIDPHAPRTRPVRQVRAAYRHIAANRHAQLALVAMVVCQSAMVGVMTMTPPHMKDHDHADLSALVIALHILGMYGAAPWVGRFADRVGRVTAIGVGAVVLGSGTVVAVVAGYVPALVFLGLFLLGLGWSIGIIAGSALLTESVDPEARVEVQGAADLTMSFCGGLAAFGSGFVKQAWGYAPLADLASVAAAALLVVTWFLRHQPISAPAGRPVA